MGLCEVISERDTLDTQEGYLLKPGSPVDSIIFQRMNRRDKHQMPPLGSSQIDRQGVSIIEAWIQSIDTCQRN